MSQKHYLLEYEKFYLLECDTLIYWHLCCKIIMRVTYWEYPLIFQISYQWILKIITILLLSFLVSRECYFYFLTFLVSKTYSIKESLLSESTKNSKAQLCHLPESLQNFSTNIDSIRDVKIIDVKSLIIKRVAMH